MGPGRTVFFAETLVRQFPLTSRESNLEFPGTLKARTAGRSIAFSKF